MAMRYEGATWSGCACHPESPALSRRRFLAGGSTLLASRATPSVGQTPPRAPRVDVHHHFVPPEYAAKGGPFPFLRDWTVQKSLEDMDKAGVTSSILSITTPILKTIAGSGDGFARGLIRASNEYGAKIVADRPSRFGLFAALPLTDVEGSLREIEYAFDVLKADGIGLFTSYGNKWLGNAAFDPVFEELNRRKAVIYTHPVSPDCCARLVPEINDSEIEYGTDTTRAIASMVFTGASQRFPDIKMIFSHGGGTMPFLIRRFLKDAVGVPSLAKVVPNGFMPEARRFFYDIAQIPIRAPLLALRDVVPVSNLVFGTDYPYLSSAEHVQGLIESQVFTADELRAIDAGGAMLVPRLRS
jgi:predicted TIM-barrel fold metal-dependent hydrolase